MSFVAEAYKEYVKENIVKFIEQNGKLPSRKDMEKLNVSVDSLMSTCGGWNKSLAFLGFDKDYVLDKVDDTQILQRVKDIQAKNGAIPTLTDLKKEKIQIKVLINKYGNWNNVKSLLKGEITEKEALEGKNKENTFNIEEAKEQLVSYIKENECVPTIKEARESGIKVSRLLKKFKTWTNVKKELDLYSVQSEIVLDKIKDVQKETIKRPTLAKLKEKDVNVKVLLKEFRTWKNACNQLNISLYDLDALKEQVEQTAERLQKTPSASEMKELGVNIKPLTKKYGSWHKAVNALGLYEYNDKLIMNEIQKLVETIDKTPTQSQLRENHISLTGIFRRYNGWEGLKEHMGLPKYSRFSNSELRDSEQKIIAIGEELGRSPKLEDVKGKGIHTSALIRQYGSWNGVLYKLGFKTTGKYPDIAFDELLDRVKSIAKKIGKTPTIQELKNEEVPVTPLTRKYGSYVKCLLELGLKPRALSNKAYDREAILSELKDLAVVLNKVPSINVAKAHDIKVHSLINDIGSWNKVKEIIEQMKEGSVVNSEIDTLRLA